MENLNRAQGIILAKAIAESWDESPPSEEEQFGPQTEAKAERAFASALAKPEVVDAKIVLGDEARADLLGQFKVYLESMENLADLTRMEEELAVLLSAD
jgi:hypothetical protein